MSKHNFTFLEVVLCIAILSLVSLGICWQMKNMVSSHNFHKNVEYLFTDLRRCQLVAVSDRTDIALKIYKKDDTYLYRVHTEYPLPCFITKEMKLIGVKEIRENKRAAERVHLNIYSSGRVEPCQEIEFIHDEKEGLILDLNTPLMIELKRKEHL